MSRRFAALPLGLVALACCTTTDHALEARARKTGAALTWSPASPPIHIRTGQSSTLLGTGELLVAGGAGSRRRRRDPAVARVGHTMTALGDVRVLVAGGGSASAELYVVTRASASTASAATAAATARARVALPRTSSRARTVSAARSRRARTSLVAAS